MRRWVGVLLGTLLIPLAAIGGEFSGAVTSDLRINLLGVPGIEIADFDADLDIDYTICGVTFGATAIVDDSELHYVLFDAWGSFGGLWFSSYAQFSGYEPQILWDLDLFAVVAGLSIGGLETYGAFIIDNSYGWISHLNRSDRLVRYGAVIGMAARIGACSFMVDVAFDGYVFYLHPHYYHSYIVSRGWFVLDAVRRPDSPFACAMYQPGDPFTFAFKTCDLWRLGWGIGVYPDETPCTPEFESAHIFVDFPLGCLDMSTEVRLDCVEGFDEVRLHIEDLDLGIPYLQIEEIYVEYGVVGKGLTLDWELALGDVACIVPRFGIVETRDDGVPVFDGIQLFGLIAEYTHSGVTLKVGTRFTEDLGWLYAFDRYGNFLWYIGSPLPTCPPPWCEPMREYDEYFALIVDGETCCGGGFGLSVCTWFDVNDDNPDGDAAGIFGWEETQFEGYLDIGPNTTLTGGLSILNEGLNWMQVGVEFVF